MSRRTGFAARLFTRLKSALRAGPCPHWADYLHDKPSR